jgi:uncharacterized protein (DUF1330 family)
MAVYLIVDITVHDPERYNQYVERAMPLVEKHGGRYLAQGGRIKAVAGDWRPERVVLIEFDQMDQVRACFSSAEYREIAPLRENSTSSRVIIVEGCSPPQAPGG